MKKTLIFGDVVSSPAGTGKITGFSENKFIVNGKKFSPKQLKLVSREHTHIVVNNQILPKILNHENITDILSEFIVFKGDLKQCVDYANKHRDTFVSNLAGEILFSNFDEKNQQWIY